MRYQNKAQKLRQSGLLYQKVKRHVLKEVKKQKQELTPKEITDLVGKVYRNYKGLRARDIRVKQIREITYDLILGDEFVKAAEFFNPLKLDVAKLSGIYWWDINEFILTILASMVTPLNVRFEVNGGEYGSTQIMDLYQPNGGLNYEYYVSGCQMIVENIRQFINSNDSEYPEWEGSAVLRSGFANDGKPDSYFVQFTLWHNGEQVPPTQSYEEALGDVPYMSLEEKRKRLDEEIARKKELINIKRKKKKELDIRGRKRPTKKQKVSKTPEQPVEKLQVKKTVDKDEARAANIQRALDRQEVQLDKLYKQWEKGIFTDKEYKAERKRLIDQTTLAISKFSKGGEV